MLRDVDDEVTAELVATIERFLRTLPTRVAVAASAAKPARGISVRRCAAEIACLSSATERGRDRVDDVLD
ncbi:MAG TPA: hypothetical protein VK488_04140 [Gaiellaceae bacterium]|nr:hypothetical protein [Gaiellaceae bacterium]